ncbi:MAG: AmmeMemoRadiSam system radical SAM enzyme [bacterium]|nr:AmmeMemoRadiSam system radical SAM enzyme [bacterium]
MQLKEAKYFRKLEGNTVQCLLCPNMCIIPEGGFGICGTRKNIGGRLYTLVYGRPVAVNIDPIEKKPLYHFLPGSFSVSVGTVGCNFRCRHCQNWEISMARADEVNVPYVAPEELVKLAQRTDCPSISYTYNEPTVFYEYVLDTARLAKAAGIRNVLVTNGYINEEPLLELLPFIDAANIDIKAMKQEALRKITPVGKLDCVLNTIKIMFEHKKWIELTYLLIPGINDDEEQLKALASFVLQELSPTVPVHVNAFHPDYKMLDVPPTPYEDLLRARQLLVDAGLKFVYIGNVADLTYQQTYCPSCGQIIIKRLYMHAVEIHLVNGRCKFCGESIPGVWE